MRKRYRRASEAALTPARVDDSFTKSARSSASTTKRPRHVTAVLAVGISSRTAMPAGWASRSIVSAIRSDKRPSLPFVDQPGYTDAFYFAGVARHIAHGDGLVTDAVWNLIEVPHLDALPVPSQRFWMPLASLLEGAGIALFRDLDPFRAAQLPIV